MVAPSCGLLLRDALARRRQRVARRLDLRLRGLGGRHAAIEIGARDRLRLPELLAPLALDLRQPRVPFRLRHRARQLLDVLLRAGQPAAADAISATAPAIAAVFEVSVIDTDGSSACSCACGLRDRRLGLRDRHRQVGGIDLQAGRRPP